MRKLIIGLLVLTTAPSAMAQGSFGASDPDNLTFRFRSNEAGARFECRVNRGIWRPCVSPARLKLRPGKYRFEVRAIDNAGNRDQSPAFREFEVVERNQEKLVLPQTPQEEPPRPTLENLDPPLYPNPKEPSEDTQLPEETQELYSDDENQEAGENQEEQAPVDPNLPVPDSLKPTEKPQETVAPPTETELPLPADKLPVNVAPPEAELKQASKDPEKLVLSCNPGLWRNNPESFKYSWKADGKSLADTQELPVSEVMTVDKLACEVEATNSLGATSPIPSTEVCLPSGALTLKAGLGCGPNNAKLELSPAQEPVPNLSQNSSPPDVVGSEPKLP